MAAPHTLSPAQAARLLDAHRYVEQEAIRLVNEYSIALNEETRQLRTALVQLAKTRDAIETEGG